MNQKCYLVQGFNVARTAVAGCTGCAMVAVAVAVLPGKLRDWL